MTTVETVESPSRNVAVASRCVGGRRRPLSEMERSMLNVVHQLHVAGKTHKSDAGLPDRTVRNWVKEGASVDAVRAESLVTLHLCHLLSPSLTFDGTTFVRLNATSAAPRVLRLGFDFVTLDAALLTGSPDERWLALMPNESMSVGAFQIKRMVGDFRDLREPTRHWNYSFNLFDEHGRCVADLFIHPKAGRTKVLPAVRLRLRGMAFDANISNVVVETLLRGWVDADSIRSKVFDIALDFDFPFHGLVLAPTNRGEQNDFRLSSHGVLHCPMTGRTGPGLSVASLPSRTPTYIRVGTGNLTAAAYSIGAQVLDAIGTEQYMDFDFVEPLLPPSRKVHSYPSTASRLELRFRHQLLPRATNKLRNLLLEAYKKFALINAYAAEAELPFYEKLSLSLIRDRGHVPAVRWDADAQEEKPNRILARASQFLFGLMKNEGVPVHKAGSVAETWHRAATGFVEELGKSSPLFPDLDALLGAHTPALRAEFEGLIQSARSNAASSG